MLMLVMVVLLRGWRRGEDDTMQGLLVVVVVVWWFDRGVVVVPCWFPRACGCGCVPGRYLRYNARSTGPGWQSKMALSPVYCVCE